MKCSCCRAGTRGRKRLAAGAAERRRLRPAGVEGVARRAAAVCGSGRVLYKGPVTGLNGGLVGGCLDLLVCCYELLVLGEAVFVGAGVGVIRRGGVHILEDGGESAGAGVASVTSLAEDLPCTGWASSVGGGEGRGGGGGCLLERWLRHMRKLEINDEVTITLFYIFYSRRSYSK